MDKDTQDTKKFLEDQLQWSKEQNRILDAIDVKLHEMKEIAKYALEEKLSTQEINKSNDQLNQLKNEVNFLEKQLQSVVH